MRALQKPTYMEFKSPSSGLFGFTIVMRLRSRRAADADYTTTKETWFKCENYDGSDVRSVSIVYQSYDGVDRVSKLEMVVKTPAGTYTTPALADVATDGVRPCLCC